MQAINLKSKLATFTEHWSPKVVGELNGQYVKLVKFQGEYVWHHHADEDEMFLVIEGRIEIHYRPSAETRSVVDDCAPAGADGAASTGGGKPATAHRIVTLNAGEFCIVPRGVEHKPVAAKEAAVLLFEPATTRNTGNVDHAYTIEADALERR